MEWTNIISDQGTGDEHCKYDYFSINGYKYCGYIPEKTVCIYNGEDGDEVPLHFYSDDYMGPNGLYTERFRGLEINFETYIDNQCTCTASVSGSPEPCIFPFKHQNKTYFTCSVDSPSDSFSAVSTPYCATAVDGNSEMTAAGTCTDTTACFPKCYAVSGRECSFPVMDDAGFEYSSCRYDEGEELMMCPVLQGRSYGVQKIDVDQAKKQECEVTSGCSFVLMCNQLALPLKNGLYFSHVGYNNLNPYPEDYTCSSSATTQESMSYYVTIHNLQIRCDLQDYFRVSSQSASSTDFRLCGNYENMPFSTISFCVMKPLSTEVDLYLNLELVSGPGEKGGYSGLYVEFFATNDEVLCPPFEDSTQNEACDNTNGFEITSPTDILSYNFPHIYPTGLSCRWTISPDSNNPTLFPVLQMVQMDLGVTSEILEEQENDTIVIGDGQQNDVNWTMLTSADESSIPFVFTDRTGTVDFTSGYYYNLHTNFKLSISYLDVSNNSQIFENAGLCLSVDKTAICHFPFSEGGQEYNSCWRLGGDTEASCKTVEGTKIFCDMSNVRCVPPFPTFNSNTQVISPVDATPGSFNVFWELSSANWDTVTILLNGQEMGSTRNENNFVLTDLATDTLYVVQLFINSFGRRDPEFYSMEFLTSAGVVQGIYLLDRSNESLRFAWDPVPDADSYTINAVPWAFNEVAARLVDTDSLDNITELTTQNAVNLTGLNAGLAYNVTIVANPVAVEIFAIGFTEPNGFSVENNELSVSVENGNFILNGIMLNDTTCQSIEVKVQRAIQYVHESDRRRSRRNIDEFKNFDNEEVLVAVFELSNVIINSENNQFQNMDLGVAEPGTWYLFVVQGFNVLPGVGVPLEMITDPDPVTNLRLIERGTDSLTFTWDPPSQGQYNFFRVQFTQGDSLLTDETSDSVLNRTGLTPGVVYKVSVTTISYQESASQTVELTEETVPLPVLTFGALGDHSTEDEDPRVISFNFQPPNPDRIGWSGFRLYTWELYYNGTRNFDLTNVTLTPEFPANVSSGTDDFPVTYMKYGTLYEADVVTLSENGDLESEPTSYKIITEPKSLESFTIAYLDDQILRANWSLDRHDNNFNGFLVQVYNNDTDELLANETFEIGGQASSGTFELDISSLDSISEFRVQVITEVEYPDVSLTADSDPAQFFITPDLPEIVDYNATLTKITAYINVSAFGDESTFLANLKKASTGESLVNISVNAADCTDYPSRCPVTFIDLDPGTDYTATVYVVSTPSPYKMSFTGDLFSTASLPDDFISTSHNASSYMMRVNFENLPFGDTDEIVQYTVVMAEKSGGSNFKADNAVNTMYWSNYIDTEDPYQVLPLENYPMTFNIEQTDQSWFVDIGVDICDPDVSIRQVCNGPLMSMTEYSLWVAGVTATGHAILSVKIGGLTTIADGISEPAIVNKSLTAFTAVFDPVLPEDATYTVQAINTLTGEISFSNIQGSSCSPNCSVELTGLQPATDYDVIITPFYSGVERRSETVVVSSSLLPDGVVVAPEFNIENPSSSFKVTVSGLPFGEDEFVSSYLVIVASEDHPTDELNNTLPTTTYAEAGIDPDNQTTSIPPYLPWGNQTYPPENTVDDTFSLVIGSEGCNGTETGFCNGPLPRNSNFKIWLATYPEGNADAIVRGPYTGFSTFPATVSGLTVISSTLTSVTFAFPVLENEVTSATDGILIEIYPAGDANNPITTYTNLTGDNPLCPQAAFLNYCLLTFAGLDPRTNYTVECVFNKTDSDETQRRDFTTEVLPNITVTHSTEDLDDPYTTLKILVDGLPFGLDTSITQYKILVSAVNETDTMENPETWAVVSVNDSWTAYTPFETKSYSTLKSDSYEGQWEFLLGEESSCPSSGACNGPLHPGTEYAIKIVGVTQTGHEITTGIFQTFSTLPIEVEFVVEATLVQIVSNFSLLDSNQITYRIEISSLPLEDSGRHDTQPLTLESCGGSSSQWCVWMSRETLPSPPDFQVCLFVEYANYNKEPYQCQTVSIPTPSEKYSEFKVTTSQDIVNPYTEVLLEITGLPFGVDSSILFYNHLLCGTTHHA
ncbi:uncharacterized protein LOC134846573 [Symsagittifera roscoffensis]|uniref:uncharacterized protein LOC134846573 n=1 Tax=Symsagittifera roscoffensis TaxID=84072 RepID=UPI00307C10E1